MPVMMRAQFPDLETLPALERKKRKGKKRKKAAKASGVQSTRLDSETK